MGDKKPTQLSRDWVRCQSKSRPDRYYMFNKKTGETNWCPDTVNLPPQNTVSARDIMKTPAQDRLKRLQNNMLKKLPSETVTTKEKGGAQAKKNVSPQRSKTSTDEKKSKIDDKVVSTQSPKDSLVSRATKCERKATLPNESKPNAAAGTSDFSQTEKTQPKHRFLIPKKPVNSPDRAMKSCKPAVTSNATETDPSLTKPKCSSERAGMGRSRNSRTSRVSKMSLSSHKSIGVKRSVQSSTSLSDIKTQSSPEIYSASENRSSATETKSNIHSSADRPSDTAQYDVNDNEQRSKEDSKPGFVTKLKEFCNKLIGKATKPAKRKHPVSKGKEKQTNLSLNSKPSFKPNKSECKAALRGVLLENESGGIPKPIPHLSHTLPLPITKVSSPIPVPNESANARLQRIRKSLHLQQTTIASTANLSATSLSLFVPETPNVSGNICSLSVSASECEPMDWQPSDECAESLISSSSLNNVPSANSSLSEHYGTVNENLLRLAAEKKLKNQWKIDHFYFVVDTNVFLQNLTFVEELTTMKLCDTMGTQIYVPYCVLQELDKLKIRSPSESIKTRSARAIKYLNKSFEEKNQRIYAQSATDETKHLIKVTSPDDSILNCCLQVKEHVYNVLLLTEDINLRNKAMCNEILVSTKSDLVSKHESLI